MVPPYAYDPLQPDHTPLAYSLMMGADLLFGFAVSFLLLHEMDAVDKKEWRLLFVLRRQPDHGALRWFIGLHLPLYVGLVALVAAPESIAIRWLEGGVDGFLVVHAGLHERLGVRGHRAFANPFSRWLIWPASVLGAGHLAYLIITA